MDPLAFWRLAYQALRDGADASGAAAALRQGCGLIDELLENLPAAFTPSLKERNPFCQALLAARREA